jgi:phenylacetate-CoA ligase
MIVFSYLWLTFAGDPALFNSVGMDVVSSAVRRRRSTQDTPIFNARSAMKRCFEQIFRKRCMTLHASSSMNRSLNYFISTPLDQLLSGNDEAGSTEPTTVEKRLLDLVEVAKRDVDAYKAVLSGIELSPQVSSLADFKEKCPFLAKQNFINVFSLKDRCRLGDLGSLEMIHVSSGSTGQPTYWARSVADELASAMRFEQIFRDSFDVSSISTLAVICFPLGSWVGGIFTYCCMRYLNMKGYRMTTVTPGNNPDEILKLVTSLSPLYEQTVLLGYPPFVRAVLDKGFALPSPVNWAAMNLRLVLAGEVFSEEWRTLICTKCNIANPQKSVVSIYGTADAGVLGCETELSAIIRKYLADHPNVARELFKKDRIPSLLQYDPTSKLFETKPDDDTLVFSSLPILNCASPATRVDHDGSEELTMPAIRYSIGDSGGLIGFEDLTKFLGRRGFDAISELRSRYAADHASMLFRKLPFVWVFGRAFWCVSMFGANVYVENIMIGLEQLDVQPFVTGKFILGLTESVPQGASTAEGIRLLIKVELNQKTAASVEIERAIAESVKAQLLRLNSEYKHYVPVEYQLPIIQLFSHGDPQYFPVGVKHKYML